MDNSKREAFYLQREQEIEEERRALVAEWANLYQRWTTHIMTSIMSRHYPRPTVHLPSIPPPPPPPPDNVESIPLPPKKSYEQRRWANGGYQRRQWFQLQRNLRRANRRSGRGGGEGPSAIFRIYIN